MPTLLTCVDRLIANVGPTRLVCSRLLLAPTELQLFRILVASSELSVPSVRDYVRRECEHFVHWTTKNFLISECQTIPQSPKDQLAAAVLYNADWDDSLAIADMNPVVVMGERPRWKYAMERIRAHLDLVEGILVDQRGDPTLNGLLGTVDDTIVKCLREAGFSDPSG
mgnify:CR=1 FL=1